MNPTTITNLASTLDYTTPTLIPQLSSSLLPLPPTIKISQTNEQTNEPTMDVKGVTGMVEGLKARSEGDDDVGAKITAAAAWEMCKECIQTLPTGAKILNLPLSLLPSIHALSLSKLRHLTALLSRTRGNLVCVPLYSSLSTTYTLSVLMDTHYGKGKTDHSKLEEAVTVMQDVFSKSLNDRTEYGKGEIGEGGSKKVLVLRTVNLLFKSYFRLNTLRLCKNISRPVTARNLHNPSNPPLGGTGEILTYFYYTGRVAMFEDNLIEAEEYLNKAYLGCRGGEGGEGNEKRVLGYLIPVRMVRGCAPGKELLAKYNLTSVYGSIVSGLLTGNLSLFNSGLTKNQRLFISKGTYLLLEKCKVLCYRNLFKRVKHVSNSTQIPVHVITTCFNISGSQVTDDETECIVANLIFKGFVKGYISHEKMTVVVSKKEPFPRSAFKKV